MGETDMSWEVWLRSQHPAVQAMFRALQSVGARVDNGADVVVRHGKTSSSEYVEARTRKMELTIEYDNIKKELKAVWQTKAEGENVTEWKIKRGTIFVPDDKRAGEFMEKLAEVILTQVMNNLPPESLYLMLRPAVEALLKGG
jgi:hypothetical protein